MRIASSVRATRWCPRSPWYQASDYCDGEADQQRDVPASLLDGMRGQWKASAEVNR